MKTTLIAIFILMIGGFVHGQELIPFKAVKLNEKWGFVDKTGKEVIALKYDSAENFKNGKAKVYSKQYATELYIDKTGQLAK
ncbi:WG repeat-containing protein [Sediminibacterium salmoneum]|uniref:WG repeat-containing protein n=1 Tax=Sediminibacterium salmoneum TaxID=426421 RepID=UPI0004787792|nr:WG repeat-containing protein [Sediminibacterium salmoneum]